MIWYVFEKNFTEIFEHNLSSRINLSGSVFFHFFPQKKLTPTKKKIPWHQGDRSPHLNTHTHTHTLTHTVIFVCDQCN